MLFLMAGLQRKRIFLAVKCTSQPARVLNCSREVSGVLSGDSERVKENRGWEKRGCFHTRGAGSLSQRFHPLLDAGTGSAQGAEGKGNVKACLVQVFFFLLVSLPGSCFALVRSPLLEEEAPC